MPTRAMAAAAPASARVYRGLPAMHRQQAIRAIPEVMRRRTLRTPDFPMQRVALETRERMLVQQDAVHVPRAVALPDQRTDFRHVCPVQMNSRPHLSRVRFPSRPSGDLVNYASTNELFSSDGIGIFISKIFPETTSRLRKPNRDCDVSIRFHSFPTKNSESALVAHTYSST